MNEYYHDEYNRSETEVYIAVDSHSDRIEDTYPLFKFKAIFLMMPLIYRLHMRNPQWWNLSNAH